MLPLLLSQVSSARWAVLFIGSSTYSNYRHHANIDTAYTLLTDRGFDKSHIVLCQYNDIPTSASNPFKGQLFHTLEHKNVYCGAEAITFSGKEVNAQLFYDVVSGVKGLKSTSEDDVFVYYDNHGGPGILGVPEGAGAYIKINEFTAAFKQLEEKKMYKHLFFMIGACYSLSMTPQITNKNMGIITSANDKESAYACTYDSKVGAYLTNEFNLNFDLIARANPDITIGEFWEKMKVANKQSHVCYAGDESIKDLKLSVFIGEANSLRPQVVDATIVNDQAHPVDATLRSINCPIEYQARNKQILETKNRFQKLSAQFPKTSFSSEYSNDYYSAIELFEQKFGAVHPDDLGEYQLLANIVARHGLKALKAAIENLN